MEKKIIQVWERMQTIHCAAVIKYIKKKPCKIIDPILRDPRRTVQRCKKSVLCYFREY